MKNRYYVCPICDTTHIPASWGGPAEYCDCAETHKLPEPDDDGAQFDTKEERDDFYEGLEN